MYRYIAICVLLFTAGCLHNAEQDRERQETIIKTEEQQQIQRDMRHNKCVSRGHVVGSPRYSHCMKVKY